MLIYPVNTLNSSHKIEEGSMRLIEKQMKLLADLLDFDDNISKELQRHNLSDEKIHTLDKTYRNGLLGSIASILESLKITGLSDENKKKAQHVRNSIYHYPWHLNNLTTDDLTLLAKYIYMRCKELFKQFDFAKIAFNNQSTEFHNGKKIFTMISDKPKERRNIDALISQLNIDIHFYQTVDSLFNDPQFFVPLQNAYGINKTYEYIVSLQSNAKALCWGRISACSKDLIDIKEQNVEQKQQIERYRSKYVLQIERAKDFRHNDRTSLIFSDIWATKLWAIVSFSQDDPKDQELISLIEEDCDVNFRNLRGTTIAIEAATHSKWCAVYTLLERGANINDANNNGQTILLSAVHQNKEVFVKDLYRRYPNLDTNTELVSGHNVLIFALQAGNIRLFEWFLDARRKLNNKIITATLKSLLTFRVENIELKDQLFAINVLLDHGADLQNTGKQDWPPLLCIGCSSQFSLDEDTWIWLLDLLVSYGADINAVDKSNNTTALSSAAIMDKPKVVEWILNHPNTDLNPYGVHHRTVCSLHNLLSKTPYLPGVSRMTRIIEDRLLLTKTTPEETESSSAFKYHLPESIVLKERPALKF